jgi:hypothetical protein
MPKTLSKYRVWQGGKIVEGGAREILEQIRAGARNKELLAMNVDEYIAALIEDAPYFVDEDLLKALQSEDYSSDADRALTYLANSYDSEVRILYHD